MLKHSFISSLVLCAMSSVAFAAPASGGCFSTAGQSGDSYNGTAICLNATEPANMVVNVAQPNIGANALLAQHSTFGGEVIVNENPGVSNTLYVIGVNSYFHSLNLPNSTNSAYVNKSVALIDSTAESILIQAKGNQSWYPEVSLLGSSTVKTITFQGGFGLVCVDQNSRVSQVNGGIAIPQSLCEQKMKN